MTTARRIPRPLLLGLFLVLGCQKGRYEKIPLHPVRGQVLFNGKPATGALVRFHPTAPPEEAKYHPAAKVEDDGSFALTTFENKDGAPAGEYTVTVRWEIDTLSGGDLPDRLKGRYANPVKSPWRIRVAEGPNELEPFRIK